MKEKKIIERAKDTFKRAVVGSWCYLASKLVQLSLCSFCFQLLNQPLPQKRKQNNFSRILKPVEINVSLDLVNLNRKEDI